MDLYENIAEKDIPTIEANDKLEVLQEPSAVWYYLCMNNEKEPFNDVKVRQAIAKCIDKQAIVDVVADGNAEPTNSFIPKGVIGYREGFDPLPYNVDEAKQMLADAGFPDGFTSTIITPESRKDHAQLIQADLKKIGIDATIEVLEAGAFWTEVEAGNYDMSVAGWSYVSMDPDVGFYSLFQSEEIISGNYVRYNNPTVDQLLEDGRQESDAAKRTQIYEDLEDITMTEVPYVPLYWKNANVAYNKDLKGVAIPMIDMYYFYGYSW